MIKKVKRIDFPETNSSSSHSVVISNDADGILDESEWGLDIDENLVLHVPYFYDFGREFFKTNSVLLKLQYLSCYYVQGYFKDYVVFSKMVHKFRDVLKDILGIKDISFENYTDFWRSKKEGSIDDADDDFYEFPSIDHNSFDIFEDITETPETIKNYLLNKNTWLYGGSDEVREGKKLYLRTETLPTVIGCFSADLGGEIGRVDVEVTDDFKTLEEELAFFRNFEKDDTGKWGVVRNYGMYHFLSIIKLQEREGRLHVSCDSVSGIDVNFELYDYGIFSI